MNKQFDIFSPLSVTLTLLSLYLIFPLYGIFNGYIDLSKYKYLDYSFPILFISLLIIVLFLTLINSYFRKYKIYHVDTLTNTKLSKQRLLYISFLFILFAFLVQFLLIKISGLTIIYALSHSLEYRFAITKNTNGILFLLYYIPIIITAIIYGYYTFLKFQVKFKLYEVFFYNFALLFGIFFSYLSGSRGNLVVFFIIYILGKNRIKKINIFSLTLAVVILLCVIGLMGAMRFGIDFTDALPLIEKQIVIRFDALIPGFLNFFDIFLSQGEKIYFGYFYFTLPFVFIPRQIMGDNKPESLENFLNSFANVADNTGQNFSALAEFFLNFHFFGIIIHLFIISIVFKVILDIYFKYYISPKYFVLYSFFILTPFAIIFISGINFYSIIKIPIIYFVVILFDFLIKAKATQ